MWTASNTDAYFAVTIHWVEHAAASTWAMKSDLAGFTEIPRAHTGERLGQALFRILSRISVHEKVRILVLIKYLFLLIYVPRLDG